MEPEIPFLKGYTVFNAEQCGGLPARYYAKAEPSTLSPLDRIERADRFFAGTGAGRVRFGDEGYAKEELVAELGAAFLAADLELTPEVRPDHAAYIGSWAQGVEGRQAADLQRRRARAARR